MWGLLFVLSLSDLEFFTAIAVLVFCLFVFLAFWARLSSHYVALLAWNTASQVLELKLSFLDVIMELWF